MKDLFSVNKAADLLERDRATLVRALRHTQPDGYAAGGKPRYFMETIAAALAVKPQARRASGKARDRYGFRSTVLDGMRVEYERQVVQIIAEPSLDRRRELALALAPLLQRYQVAYLEIGRSLRLADDDVLGARSELIWSEMMDEVSAAAEWPRHDGFFARMYEAMAPDADDDEAA